MRKALIPFLVSVGLIAVWAAPADAASTRAEYIAQADPICHSTEVAERRALGPKGTVLRLMKKGRFKAAAHRYRNSGVAYSAGVEQLAALAPPSADAQLIGNWVQMLRAFIPVVKQATSAMAHGRPVDKFLRRIGSMNVQTHALVAEFGFGYCQKL
jgi:hypothetical protein